MNKAYRGWLVRSAVAVIAAGGVMRVEAIVPTPTAPAESTGSYSVSYTPCSGCLADWLEERRDSGSWTALGQGTASFTEKPSGRYEYRAGYLYLEAYFMTWTEYSASRVVQVSGTTPQREPVKTQMTYRYRVRGTDVDGDGRKDLFLERTRGGSDGDGSLDEVVLRQRSGGLFVPRKPTAAERTASAGWPVVATGVVLRDVNVDGFVDVVLKGVAGAVGATVPDQIVYAPGYENVAARGVRAVDSKLRRFGADMVEYVKDPDYFRENARWLVYTDTYYEYVCYDGYYQDYGYFPNCYPVPVEIVVVYPDYSTFSGPAVRIWNDEESIEQRLVSTTAGLEDIEKQIESVLEIDVAEWDIRELIGRTVPDAGMRHGMELFTALLGVSTAHAQESAPAVPADAVQIRGRKVMGFGPLHTALQYLTTTISGYDDDDRALYDGTLVSQVNWPPDHPLLTMALGTVSGGLPATYWGRLRTADANYDDDLRYDALPSIGRGGYNSNGYANGIIRATSGVPSLRMEDFVGGEVPVPRSEFE